MKAITKEDCVSFIKHKYRSKKDIHFKNYKAFDKLNHMTHAFHATAMEGRVHAAM